MRKNNDIAREYGMATARHMYTDLVEHPEYKGTKFEWSRFPMMVYRFAYVGCFTAFSHRPKNLLRVKRIAGRMAKREAVRLMQDNRWK